MILPPSTAPPLRLHPPLMNTEPKKKPAARPPGLPGREDTPSPPTDSKYDIKNTYNYYYY